MTDLLPCPFCGGKPYVTQKDPYPYSYVQWGVGCMPCSVSMSDGKMISEEIAVKAWNTRAYGHANDTGAGNGL